MGKQEFVKLRLTLAKEKIKAAQTLVDSGSYRDAVSRAYYAIYYAAKAFLFFHGKDPHTHKGVSILFHEFCKKHKYPDASFARMISRTHEARLEAEYKETAHITKMTLPKP